MGHMLLYGIHLPTWNYMNRLQNKSHPFWLRTRQSRKKHCYCQNPGLSPTNSQVQKYYYCFVKFVKVSLWVQSGCGKWEDGEGNKTVWNLNAYIQLTNYRYIRTQDCTYLPSTSIQCYLLQSDAAPSWWYNRKTTPPSQKTTIIDKFFNTLDIFFFFFFFL